MLEYILCIGWGNFATIIIEIPNRNITGNSKYKISCGESNGAIREVIPNTERILNIFDPTIFPTEIALSFLNAAMAEVASSGSDVPKATTLIPITISEMPRYRAKNIAPSTNKFAPNASAIVPPRIYKIVLFKESSAWLSFSDSSCDGL